MEESASPRPKRLFTTQSIRRALGSFSVQERSLFTLLVFTAGLAALFLIYAVNDRLLVPVPADGGTLREGIVGTPRFVNPLLATTDADRDLTSLVYRGLMKKDTNGEIVPDLASAYTVSKDGLNYTFTLKDAKFQDGTPITADDVLFTVKSARDSTLKSAHRVEWEGVVVKAVDDKTIMFTLKDPFSPFLESTTLGIMPKHIWEKIPYESWTFSDFNTTRAVGSGPYKVSSMSTNSSGIPDYYKLVASRNGTYAPRIDTIVMRFYANEKDLVDGFVSNDIDTLAGIEPESSAILEKKGATILTTPLPRVFGLFFNQNESKVLTDPSLRKAIDTALDRDAIVNTVLLGYGRPIASPLPDLGLRASNGITIDHAAQARTLLEKAGWKKGSDGIYTRAVSKKETRRASFELATSDASELAKTANLIKDQLAQAGIEVTVKVYEGGSLSQDVIRPRKFEALFFGEVVGTSSDLYAFWHSSQRNDPGLNISGYANPRVDKLLEQMLATSDTAKVDTLRTSFKKEIATDTPAVFVYAPTFMYAVRDEMPGVALPEIGKPQDRFTAIETWYLSTDKVWKIFAK
jgi:peptide/nickel transport system substrate-binding protein